MTERQFEIDGQRYSEADMLSANAHDADVCEWVMVAKPGDVFADMQRVVCVGESA